MAQPSAPPPYDDKNSLYPPPPGGYPQPPHYAGGYSQPGGYPAAGGYMPPGGYPAGGGYPQPGMAMPTMPVRFGKWGQVGLCFRGGWWIQALETGLLWGAAQPILMLRGVPHRR